MPRTPAAPLTCARQLLAHASYVKVMTKASDAADFVTKETTRLKKMMDDGSVKAEKKGQFGRRLNMLSSFA